MDPNFVQHSVGDVSARFAGLLLFLLGIGVFQYSALQVVFKTGLYEKYFDGKSYDLKPWVSLWVGLFLAWGLDLNFAFYLLGLTEEQVVGAYEARQKIGLLTVLPPDLTVLVCETLTGMALGGGPKVFVGMAKTFAEVRDAIVKAIQPKQS